MLESVIADGGRTSVSELARAGGTPIATAHRQVTTLTQHGFLRRSGHGRYIAGPRLLGLQRSIDEKQVLTKVAEPILDALARRIGLVVQLGTLEQDMVTYRIKSGTRGGALFTKVGMQLEAYCSGIGKVLLSHLPDEQREAYLASGPFVALTNRTLVSARDLKAELALTRARGFALDKGEIANDLYCCAVPLQTPGGQVPAAISVSQLVDPGKGCPEFEPLVAELQAAAREIEIVAFGTSSL